jgi:3-hydroxyisobutyrate dehydrogenase/putative dehydrogenase
MKRIGIVGLGNMGMGMARNLVARGFDVHGYARSSATLDAFEKLGGRRCSGVAAVGAASEAVFVMVVDAGQSLDVVDGPRGLLATMQPGAILIVTATIGRAAVERIAELAQARQVTVIDCPVSGGRKGAEAGQLTLMAAGDRGAFDRCADAFDAIAANVNYVGDAAGQGQVVKACLQGLVGCIYAGMFEAVVLGVKAGVRAETLFSVIGTSVANTPLFQASIPAVMDRTFRGTGSSIVNTSKDLGITLALAERCGMPMMTTAAARQFFQAGLAKYPDDDNQCLVKVLEDIVGVRVERSTPAADG